MSTIVKNMLFYVSTFWIVTTLGFDFVVMTQKIDFELSTYLNFFLFNKSIFGGEFLTLFLLPIVIIIMLIISPVIIQLLSTKLVYEDNFGPLKWLNKKSRDFKNKNGNFTWKLRHDILFTLFLIGITSLSLFLINYTNNTVFNFFCLTNIISSIYIALNFFNSDNSFILEDKNKKFEKLIKISTSLLFIFATFFIVALISIMLNYSSFNILGKFAFLVLIILINMYFGFFLAYMRKNILSNVLFNINISFFIIVALIFIIKFTDYNPFLMFSIVAFFLPLVDKISVVKKEDENTIQNKNNKTEEQLSFLFLFLILAGFSYAFISQPYISKPLEKLYKSSLPDDLYKATVLINPSRISIDTYRKHQGLASIEKDIIKNSAKALEKKKKDKIIELLEDDTKFQTRIFYIPLYKNFEVILIQPSETSNEILFMVATVNDDRDIKQVVDVGLYEIETDTKKKNKNQ